MNRRGFLVAASGLLAAGCARVTPPSPVTSAPRSTPASPLVIGADSTPPSLVLATLLARGLAAKGRTAGTDVLGEAWQAALGSGELAAQPAWAGTLWDTLSEGGERPAVDDLAGEVAGLLAPEISVLPASRLDGSLVWVVTEATAQAGVTELDRIATWSKGKHAAVPDFALSRADGVPGLETAYGASFAVTRVDDPIERARTLTTGAAGIAAFRRSEFSAATGLVELKDTDAIGEPDPGVLLVSSTLVEAEPDQVLTLDAVAGTLTTAALRELQAQVAAGGSVADVADAWLRAQGLA